MDDTDTMKLRHMLVNKLIRVGKLENLSFSQILVVYIR